MNGTNTGKRYLRSREVESNFEKQIDVITRGVVDIVRLDELIERIKDSIDKKKPLRVKLGVDPTTSDIHLGHTIVLKKLRDFQNLGHQAILIIGDFTAIVGDPSGKDKTRPMLDEETIQKNAKTYLEQVGKILDLEKLEVRKNSEWLKRLNLQKLIELASKITVAQLLERGTFDERFQNKQPISLHELLYPIMQAYDSVEIKADIEIGAVDQTFNLNVGRDLQREFSMLPQIAITMPILVGLDGSQKMSKSLQNHIGVNDEPYDMFGKVMSIPDVLMKDYFTLLTDFPKGEIDNLLSEKANAKDAKEKLAYEIVKGFHNEELAKLARSKFNKIFSQKEIPDDAPIIEIKMVDILLESNALDLVKILRICEAAHSNSEARRLIEQNAVELNNQVISNFTYPSPDNLKSYIHTLKVGKRRFYKVKFV